jgi:hypothetical protein
MRKTLPEPYYLNLIVYIIGECGDLHHYSLLPAQSHSLTIPERVYAFMDLPFFDCSSTGGLPLRLTNKNN